MIALFIYLSGMKCMEHPSNVPVGFCIGLLCDLLLTNTMKNSPLPAALHLGLR